MSTQLAKRRVVSNMVIMGSGTLATWVISTFHLFVVSRYLGPHNAGALGLAGLVVGLVGLVMGLGMDTVITRATARDYGRAASLVSAAILARAIIAVPGVTVVLVYVHVAHLSRDFALINYISLVSLVIGALMGPIGAAFAGREQMSFGAIGSVVGNTLDLLFLLIIVKINGGVVAFAVEGLILTLIGVGMTLYFMRGNVRLTRRVTRGDVREVVVGGLPFWFNGVFLVFYFIIDGIILAWITHDPGTVGQYNPAQRMFGVILFLPGIITGATFPLLARLGVNVGDDFVRVNRKIISLLIACAFPLMIGLVTFARPLILTVYGPKYHPAVEVLSVLGFCAPFTFLDSHFSAMVTARNEQWRWTAVLAASCVINPLLNFVTIPYFMHHGDHNPTVGAAVAVLITEVLMTVYGVALLRDIVVTRRILAVTAGGLAAGAAQWGMIWLTRGLWPPLGQALGVGVYLALALALGVFAREDLIYLWRTFAGQVRGVGRRRDRGAPPPVGEVVAEHLPPVTAAEQTTPVVDSRSM